jgi:membrane protein DedA with SNARE-associated domain
MEIDAIFQAMLANSGARATECGALFLFPFLQENLAIVGGAMLIVGHRLPAWLALTSLYAGMISSDVLLYGLGAAARRNGLARRILIGPRVHQLGGWVRGHMGPIVLVARFVPGLIIPSYVACGWFGTSLKRFAVMCMASAAVYLPIALALIIAFGKVTVDRYGDWAWVGLIVPITVVGLLRAIPFAWQRNGAQGRENRAPLDPSGSILLEKPRRLLSVFEFWPGFMFYVPVALYWAWQGLRHRSFALPAVANPLMEHGGLCGESKLRLFDSMGAEGRNWLAPYVSIVRGEAGEADRDLERLVDLARANGLDFPLVAKPDIGCHGAGVQVVRDAQKLRCYLEVFPPGESLLLQRLIHHEGEAGVFYVRQPGEIRGRIISLTLKFFPHVRGDGESTLERLIRADARAGRVPHLYIPRNRHRLNWVPALDEKVPLVFAGNHCKGAVFRNGFGFITPALTRRIDELAKSIPAFHFGRFDVRFASLAELQRGEGFTIVEFNGGGSEATHIWDADTTLRDAYSALFQQVRLLFEIGAVNRDNGHRPEPALQILRAWRHEWRLKKRYPITE